MSPRSSATDGVEHLLGAVDLPPADDGDDVVVEAPVVEIDVRLPPDVKGQRQRVAGLLIGGRGREEAERPWPYAASAFRPWLSLPACC
jgi:hypothetical protein